MFFIVYYDLVMAIFFVESLYGNLQFLYYNLKSFVILEVLTEVYYQSTFHSGNRGAQNLSGYNISILELVSK